MTCGRFNMDLMFRIKLLFLLRCETTEISGTSTNVQHHLLHKRNLTADNTTLSRNKGNELRKLRLIFCGFKKIYVDSVDSKLVKTRGCSHLTVTSFFLGITTSLIFIGQVEPRTQIQREINLTNCVINSNEKRHTAEKWVSLRHSKKVL